jgi:hypothetical protein
MRYLALLVALSPFAAAQAPLIAADIMARVAANQDRADKLRREYVYQQHVHVVSRLTNGKLKREETADYQVFPTPEGSEKKLQLLSGRYLQKGKYVDFTGKPQGDEDNIDHDLVGDFREDLVNEKSRDGFARDLFPLTSDRQKDYDFRLLGEAQQDGRTVYRIGFRPRDKDELAWAGEALIDKEEFQPVLVFTKLNRKLPLAVRTVLGTDLPGVGFTVHYRRQPDGVWFPVSFGTEFRLRVLFAIKRDLSVSLENRNFEHTHVESKIKVLAPE